MASNDTKNKPLTTNKPLSPVRPKPITPSNEQFRGNFDIGKNKGTTKED